MILSQLKKYAKFTRVSFTTSGKTCPKVQSSIKLVSRTQSYISFGCVTKLLRPLYKVYVEFDDKI